MRDRSPTQAAEEEGQEEEQQQRQQQQQQQPLEQLMTRRGGNGGDEEEEAAVEVEEDEQAEDDEDEVDEPQPSATQGSVPGASKVPRLQGPAPPVDGTLLGKFDHVAPHDGIEFSPIVGRPSGVGGIVYIFQQQRGCRVPAFLSGEDMETRGTVGLLRNMAYWFDDGLYGQSGGGAADYSTRDIITRLVDNGDPVTRSLRPASRVEHHRTTALNVKWARAVHTLLITRMLPDLAQDVAAVSTTDGGAALAERLQPACTHDLELISDLAKNASPFRTLITWAKDAAADKQSALARWISMWLRCNDDADAEAAARGETTDPPNDVAGAGRDVVRGGATATVVVRDDDVHRFDTLAERFVSQDLVCQPRALYNAILFATHVATLPLLMIVARQYTTLRQCAPSIIYEYHMLTNMVGSLEDWKDLAKRLGADDEDELSRIWVTLSKWMVENSDVRVLAGRSGLVSGPTATYGTSGAYNTPARSVLIVFITTFVADEVVVDDGDGFTLYYWKVPPEIMALFSRRDECRGGAATAAISRAYRSGEGGRVVVGFKVVCRVAGFDAPEWTQPFLVAKKQLEGLLQGDHCTTESGRPLCRVRISEVYYADNGRVFVDAMLSATEDAATSAPSYDDVAAAVGEPPVGGEASVRLFLLAAGAVFLMPQYFWCMSVEELHLSLQLYALAKARSKDNRLPASPDDPKASIDHLCRVWEATVGRDGSSGDSHLTKKLRAFQQQLARGDKFDTADAYIEALGPDWHTSYFNVHLLESKNDAPLKLPTNMIPFGHFQQQGMQWWRHPSDPGKFPAPTMIWGKPHHAKDTVIRKPATKTTKRKSSSLSSIVPDS